MISRGNGKAASAPPVIRQYDTGRQPQRRLHQSNGSIETFGLRLSRRAIPSESKPSSGKPSSFVTRVAKASNHDWDKSVWLLYDRLYALQEAWEWNATAYQQAFHEQAHVRSPDMRRGRRIFPPAALLPVS